MKRLFMCAVTVIFAAEVCADDPPDYPRKETLYPLEGDISSSLINLTCRPYKDSEHLDCEILQVMFTKPNVEDVSSDADIDKIALYAPDARRHAALTRGLGFKPDQVQEPLFGVLGNTGADKARLTRLRIPGASQ